MCQLLGLAHKIISHNGKQYNKDSKMFTYISCGITYNTSSSAIITLGEVLMLAFVQKVLCAVALDVVVDERCVDVAECRATSHVDGSVRKAKDIANHVTLNTIVSLSLGTHQRDQSGWIICQYLPICKQWHFAPHHFPLLTLPHLYV